MMEILDLVQLEDLFDEPFPSHNIELGLEFGYFFHDAILGDIDQVRSREHAREETFKKWDVLGY